MRFGIDLDGCLANFNHAYGELLIKVSHRDTLPQGWRNHAVNPTVWDWDKAAGYTKDERDKAWKVIHTTDYWFNLEPLPDAVEAIEKLNDLAENHDVYFITHRSGKQCKQQSEDWLFGHGMASPTVLIAGHNKNPLIEGLELNFYIDDKWDGMIRAAQIKNHKDINLYMKDAPYNKIEIPGVRRVASVLEGLNHFTEHNE